MVRPPPSYSSDDHMLGRKFVIARGPIRWFLLASNSVGITMPWGRVYMLAPWLDDRLTRFHELVHLRQIQRDGAVFFTCRYLWWLIRYGYWKNPYEVEAYRLEASARARIGPGKPRLAKRARS
jgi:hypothetical protein